MFAISCNVKIFMSLLFIIVMLVLTILLLAFIGEGRNKGKALVSGDVFPFVSTTTLLECTSCYHVKLFVKLFILNYIKPCDVYVCCFIFTLKYHLLSLSYYVKFVTCIVIMNLIMVFPSIIYQVFTIEPR